jgi:hypothetical protein
MTFFSIEEGIEKLLKLLLSYFLTQFRRPEFVFSMRNAKGHIYARLTAALLHVVGKNAPQS